MFKVKVASRLACPLKNALEQLHIVRMDSLQN